MSTHRDPDPYGWLDDRPLPAWRRINWWSVTATVLFLAIVLFTVGQCSATFMGGQHG